MSKLKCDIAVVGAGPSGLTLASSVAGEGGDVLILEEHPQVGLPQHCAGKVSVNALREIEVEAEGVLQKVKGAVFYPPNLNPFSIRSSLDQAFILDRRIFDQALSEKAVKAGARLYTNSRVKRVSIEADCVTVVFERDGEAFEAESRMVAGADGAASYTARLVGLYSKKSYQARIGVQRVVSGVETVQDMVELYFGNRWAPGFFAWIVPTGSDTAKVGLAVKPNPPKPAFDYLDDFMEEHPVASEKLQGCRVLGQSIHIIPTGGAIRRTVSDGVLIVGDAAGQVKSTTGGGLYYGMACAKIAGKAVIKALENSSSKILREEALMGYEGEWRTKLAGEIAFSARAREFLDSLSDEEVDYLFNTIRGDKSILKLIEKEGDIDHQSRLAFTLLRYVKYVARKPGLIFKLRKFFPIAR